MHFAGESFLYNLHLKQTTFGLYVKPHVSYKKLIITKVLKIKNFFDCRSNQQRCSVEKNVFTGKHHLCWSLFITKLQTFSALQLYWKGTLTLDFSGEICEICKNIYFEEQLRTNDCFSNLKHGICVFHNIFFFHSKLWISIKIQTMSLVLNIF